MRNILSFFSRQTVTNPRVDISEVFYPEDNNLRNFLLVKDILHPLLSGGQYHRTEVEALGEHHQVLSLKSKRESLKSLVNSLESSGYTTVLKDLKNVQETMRELNSLIVNDKKTVFVFDCRNVNLHENRVLLDYLSLGKINSILVIDKNFS